MVVISSALALYAIVRGRRSQPDLKADPAEIVIETDEKDGLMEGQEEQVDPPPLYTEAPAVSRDQATSD